MADDKPTDETPRVTQTPPATGTTRVTPVSIKPDSNTKVVEDMDPKPALEKVIHEEEPRDTELMLPNDNADVDALNSYARDLAFMNEMVEIMILDNPDARQDSTRLVTVGINGVQHFLLRGQWKKVPRYVAENIITSKKEAWTFNSRTNLDGSTSDVSNMARNQRFPYQFRDNTAKGQAWFDNIRNHHR
jgi:hypothetical protein